jgi:hypothetical protein
MASAAPSLQRPTTGKAETTNPWGDQMKKSTLLSALLGALFVAGLAIAPAHAQATRTWVSGVGDDANPCSRTAPCKTWPGAISKTAAGGEIDALDPGGFGTVTITKSITLDGGGGQVASILASPGVNGINVSAAATDVIILRNLRINGAGGGVGVQVNTAGKVVVEKCDIFEFASAAVNVTPGSGTVMVKIQETNINNNGAGVLSKPTGGATVNMSIDHSFIDANTGGAMKIDGTGGGSSNVAVNDSSMSLNGGTGANAVSGPSGNVNVDLMRDVLAKNGTGVQTNNTSGGTVQVTVGQSMLSNNGTAWSVVGPALLSYGNNQVTGPMGSTPGTISPQ